MCARPSGDILGSIVSNSHLWKHSGARVMHICVFQVGPHFPNFGYFQVYRSIWWYSEVFRGIWRYLNVYKGIQRYMKAYEGVKIWPLGMPWGVSYDHFRVLCWSSFSWYLRFWSIWDIRRYINVFGGICRYMKVHKGIWRYMKVYEVIWRYMEYFEKLPRPLIKGSTAEPPG